MAKIHTLRISNYRGLDQFEQVFGLTDFVCIIGRGDSGKSTILEAISIVLSSNWNVSFYDTDFFNLNIDKPIEIEASVYDIPLRLIQDDKYGLYIRGLDKSSNTIHDDIKDSHEPILTIKLKVEKDLEPKWYVINKRLEKDLIEIKANDRSLLNQFFISDYIERHFSWNKGNPLYSLLKEDDNISGKTNVILEAFRQAIKSIDPQSFEHLQPVLTRVKISGENFGVTMNNLTSNIDYKDVSVKDGRITLHENNIPLRLKGKGSKRLLSVAIQTELLKVGGILLIDEVEQGLEPDRVQHLVKLLKSQNNGQVFITTHSRDVLVELQFDNIFLLRKNQLIGFDISFQGCLRRNPEAFFSKKVIVCEGATEVGICRAINKHKIKCSEPSYASLGIGIVDGAGSNFVTYCQKFKEAGFNVCAFCDSDDEGINSKKAELQSKQIKVFDWDDGRAIEHQVFLDLPWQSVQRLIDYVVDIKEEDVVKTLIQNQCSFELPSNWYDIDTPEIRIAIGKAACLKKKKRSGDIDDKGWFKRIDHGEFLGDLLCDSLRAINEKRLGKQLAGIFTWVYNA
jgi:putative ATP-dependent endonuclease of OLD family